MGKHTWQLTKKENLSDLIVMWDPKKFLEKQIR